MWAIFSPDGELQVRSLAYTRKQSRLQINKTEGISHEDYFKEGYTENKVLVDIKLL